MVEQRPFKALVASSSLARPIPGRRLFGWRRQSPPYNCVRAMHWLRILTTLFMSAVIPSLHAADFDVAAKATNQFGLDLHRQFARPDENLCLSPYSIQNALAMTYAGADGATRSEMAGVLHYPNDGDAIHASFAALNQSLQEMAKKTAEIVQNSKRTGGPSEPITLAIANRLFAQNGYDFRDSFRALVQKYYGAPFEALNFRENPEAARQHINRWVAEQTRDRIRDLIPANGLNEMVRLVLANAIYVKAPWASEFSAAATQPQPFHVRGGGPADVPTMHQNRSLGYAKREGFTAIGLPYVGRELQFLVLLPDDVKGLPSVESKLTADALLQCARLEARDLNLFMPKFKFEPPTIPLSAKLKALDLKSAFDQPRGSANFDRIAPRKPDDYLYISEVFHKTFIAVDEKGTEAAAATAVAMMATTARIQRPQPIEVKIDRPFLYAIQHVPSGTCLFLGHVTDPR
jgi:serpin B